MAYFSLTCFSWSDRSQPSKALMLVVSYLHFFVAPPCSNVYFSPLCFVNLASWNWPERHSTSYSGQCISPVCLNGVFVLMFVCLFYWSSSEVPSFAIYSHVYFHFRRSKIYAHTHTHIDLCLLNRSVSCWSYKRGHSLLSTKWWLIV